MKIIFCIALFTLSLACCAQSDTAGLANMLGRGQAYEDKGDYVNAIKINLEIIDKYPDHAPASMNTIAGLYGKMENFYEEIKWASKAIKAHSGYTAAYINLANAYGATDNLDSAQIYYEEAVRLSPRSFFANFRLGAIAEARGNYAKALDYFKLCVTLDTNFINGYYNISVSYANLNNFEMAEKYVEKVIRMNPADSDAIEMQKNIKQRMKNH